MVSTPKPNTACGDPTPPGGAAAAATVSGARPLSSMMSATRRSCSVRARISSSKETPSTTAAITAEYAVGIQELWCQRYQSSKPEAAVTPTATIDAPTCTATTGSIAANRLLRSAATAVEMCSMTCERCSVSWMNRIHSRSPS